MKSFLCLCPCLAMIAFCHPLHAQVLPFHYYTIEQGLVANGAGTLFQDSRGYIWIGTGEGLSVFDGTAFHNYTVNEGLAINGVTSISESRLVPGTMFLGTFGGGINKFSNNTFSTLLPDSLPSARQIYSVEEDYQGRIWCVAGNGLYRMTNGAFTLLPQLADVSIVAVSPDSLVWLGGNRTLAICSSPHGGVETMETISAHSHRRIIAMHADRGGGMCVSTRDSLLIRFMGRKIVAERKIPFGSARCIADDANGNLWVGTESGLLSIEREKMSTANWIRYGTENGLRMNLVSTCLVDFENSVWGGNGDEGLFRLTERNLFTFPLTGVPTSYNNSKAVADKRGHIWAVTMNGLMEIWKDSAQWRSYSHAIPIDPKGKSTLSIVRDKHGRFWVDTKQNIQCLAVDSTTSGHSLLRPIKTLRTGVELPVFPRFFFIVDSTDRLWASVIGKGVYRVDPWHPDRPFVQYTLADGLPSNDIRVIYADRRNDLWFGAMAEGLGCMAAGNGSPIRLYSVARRDGNQGLPDDLIRGVLEDNNGKIWVATRRNGIGVLNNDSITNLSVKNGLIGGAVWAVAGSDESDLIWAGTHMGVQSIDARTMKISKPYRVLLGHPVTSIGEYRNQFIWFVSNEALNVYEFMHPPNAAPPPTYITNLKVNGTSVDLRNIMEFNHDQNILLFEYIGISFVEREAQRYQYRLSGFDEGWNPPTAERTVTYASVAPGSYRFEVRAINANGLMSRNPASISFVIAYPFWQRWWFLLFAVAFVAGSTSLAFRRRLAKVHREQRAQQEFSRRLIDSQENERKRIAGELHDSLGQNLLVIRNRALLGLKDSAIDQQTRHQFDQISFVATQSINEVREIAYDLRPYQLDRLGLTKAIMSITSGLATSVQFVLSIDPIDEEIGRDHAIHVYRIIQEGINNILKHAAASEARVAIGVEETNIRITITDNGRGIPQERSGSTDGLRGFGFAGMNERAKVLNGTVDIESMPGKGSRLTVLIPRSQSRHQ